MTRPKIVWYASRPSPSLPPLHFHSSLPLSLPFPLPFLPLEVGTPNGGWESAQAPPAVPGRARPPCKGFLAHFRPKFVPFWVPNAALSDDLSSFARRNSSVDRDPTKGFFRRWWVMRMKIDADLGRKWSSATSGERRVRRAWGWCETKVRARTGTFTLQHRHTCTDMHKSTEEWIRNKMLITYQWMSCQHARHACRHCVQHNDCNSE